MWFGPCAAITMLAATIASCFLPLNTLALNAAGLAYLSYYFHDILHTNVVPPLLVHPIARFTHAVRPKMPYLAGSMEVYADYCLAARRGISHYVANATARFPRWPRRP